MLMEVSRTLLDWVLDNIHFVFKPFLWIFQLTKESFTFPNFWGLWQRSISSAWCFLHHDWGGVLICSVFGHHTKEPSSSWRKTLEIFCHRDVFVSFSDLDYSMIFSQSWLEGFFIAMVWLRDIVGFWVLQFLFRSIFLSLVSLENEDRWPHHGLNWLP